jgi:subtilisin family serine protease
MTNLSFWMRSCISFCLLFYLLGCGDDGGGGGPIPDPTTNDLDLHLYNDSRTLVDTSQGTGSTESVQTSTAGDYYIGVESYSGASNYILSIGRSEQSFKDDIESDFVPGDIIIAFKKNNLILQSEDSSSRTITAFGMTRKGGAPGRAQLFHFDGLDTKRVMDAIGINQSDHTLTGTIIATSNSIIDSDVNDPFAPYASNDTMDNAQILPNPVVLGGYANTAFSGYLGRSYSSGDPEDYFRVSLTDNQTIRLYIANASSNSSDAVDTQAPQSTEIDEERAQLKRDTLRVIQELNKHEDVLYAEPNYYRRAYFTPDDTYYSRQWHYPLIKLEQAWEITRGLNSVIVAVIDTGILSQHPDIKDQLVNDGYDFISSTTSSLDGDGRDDDPEDPGDQSLGGSSFHGTHVAGTIAAATNNTVGVAGVAGDVRIMALRALGKDGIGTSNDINQAILYAAGLPNASGALPAQKADIINMSFGGGGNSMDDQNIINAARAEGVIIIAAAGNESTSSRSYPAAYEGIISVSAVDANKDLAPYSNYGSTIDVAAPGGDMAQDVDGDGYSDGVLSTRGDDTSDENTEYVYNFLQGTSMACPHMAGVAALMKSVKPDLTPSDLDLLLASGIITEDIGDPGQDFEFGNGLIDAYKAVSEAQGGIIPALLFVNPSPLNFGSSTEDITLTAEKEGDGTLILESVTDDADWLTVTADVVNADYLGTYIASVDRTDLLDGPYYATITFESDSNQVNIGVTMYQGDISATGNLGFHYVLLMDALDNNQLVDQVEVSPLNGLYPYSFTDVSSGLYSIYAGTDSDNDGYIGDAGEALGAYISLDQPVAIDVDSNLSDLDFTTSFNVNLPGNLSTRNIKHESGIKRMGIE